MKARIVSIPPERIPLYAETLAGAAAEIYTEVEPSGLRAESIASELARLVDDSALLLLVAEVVDPTQTGRGTGYATGAVLLTVPHRDPLLGTSEPWLRILHTRSAFRQRGLAAALLQRAQELLSAAGHRGLRTEVIYGDDAVTGVFERRGWIRGRMTLQLEFAG